MKLTQGQKLIVGFFTLLPFVMIPFYLYHFFFFFTEMIQNSVHDHMEPNPVEIMSAMIPMFVVGGILSLTSIGLLIFYIIHLVKNTATTGTDRIVWILLFVFAGLLAFPVYFFMKVWNDNPTS